MAGEFVLFVTVDVDPADMDTFIGLARRNAETSVREEPGCRRFEVMTDPQTPGRVHFCEVYADGAAFESHMKAAHVGAFFGAATPLIREQSHRVLSMAVSERK